MRVAVGAGLALVALLLVVTLSQGTERRTESNAVVQVSGVALSIRPGKERCQTTDLPSGTELVRLFGEAPRGSTVVSLRITTFGQPVTAGRTASVRGEERVDIPLESAVARETLGERLCIANTGMAPVRFAGNRTPPIGPANPGGAVLGDDIRVDYLKRGEQSWWSTRSVVAERFGLLKASFFGLWTLWAAMGLVVLSWLLAIRTLMRSVRL